jgi:hypothetical protein
MRLTKTDMAQVIVTALTGKTELARPGHPMVLALVKRHRTTTLLQAHAKALRVIEQRLSKEHTA